MTKTVTVNTTNKVGNIVTASVTREVTESMDYDLTTVNELIAQLQEEIDALNEIKTALEAE